MTILNMPSKFAIVIASHGRPKELGRWPDHIAGQTLSPSQVIFSVSNENDLPDQLSKNSFISVCYGLPGLTMQRNRGLALVDSNCDFVAFFDDDYIPTRKCLENAVAFFAENPEIVGANGVLLADGINSPGIEFDEAVEIINDYEINNSGTPEFIENCEGLYGCNMVYKYQSIKDFNFDESLPLYGWQEDVDFASRVRSVGRIVKTNAFAGVHLGVKTGRSSGVRLGYSQIANPVYLYRKGTISCYFALNLVLRNLIANHLKCMYPEAWIDRRGRLKGNWLAIRDCFYLKLDPRRVIEL